MKSKLQSTFSDNNHLTITHTDARSSRSATERQSRRDQSRCDQSRHDSVPARRDAVAACRPSSLPPPNSRTLPSEFSHAPTANTAAKDDLWGSNASL